VDACTVTTLDAITAFAVPNPSCSSQSPPVFSGLAAFRVAPACRSLSLLRTGNDLFSPTLSTVDGSKGNTASRNVNAHNWCNERNCAVDFGMCNHLQSLSLSGYSISSTRFSTIPSTAKFSFLHCFTRRTNQPSWR